MRKPLTLRPLTHQEYQTLVAGLRSTSSFTWRRCQILLASQRGQHARQIADSLCCGDQTVRNVIHEFNPRGLAALQPRSTAPHHLPPAVFATARREQLRDLLHQSPRTFGYATSVWTLPLAAQVAYAEGIPAREVSGEAIRHALHHLRGSWQRAKHWITSPAPAYLRKKKQRDRLIRLAPAHPGWVLGFAEEVWWSRLAQPHLHSWAPRGGELRLLQKAPLRGDPDPNALACYGLLVRATTTTPEPLWLRFAQGQPVSGITIQFLAWCCQQLALRGKPALLLMWDNAAWHKSQAVQGWLRAHNHRVKQTHVGVRIVSCRLPTPSPWLNPSEPKWVHGNRAGLEPERVLTAAELEARVYAYYGCQPEPCLSITQKAA